MGTPGRFEWDDDKSAANKAKHGIDFAEATGLWDDPRGMTRPAASRGEPRAARVAAWTGRLWFAVFTLRGGSIRIIPVRRARKDEEKAYGRT